MPVKELSRLEAIISKDIPNLIRTDCRVNDTLRSDFEKALEKQSEQVKIALIARIAQADKKKDVRKYIRQQQHNLIMLNNQLVKHSEPERIAINHESSDPKALYYSLYKMLDDLLGFMERHFIGYFDPDAWLPVSYRLIAAQEIRQGIDHLEAQLYVANVDEELVKLIFQEFRQFLDHELGSQITWRKAKYLKDLKAELSKLVDNQPASLTEAVHLLLISMNFNNLSFSTWYTNFIVSEINKVEEPALRLNKLTLLAKQVNQVRDRHSCTLDMNYQPIKQQIAAWLMEELNFQQTSQLKFDLKTTSPSADRSGKLEFDLSVPEISCLLWGLKGTEVMKNSVMLEVFGIVEEMFSSKRMETLSAESIRNHYYTIEYMARIKMADKFQAMADLLRSGKSPGKPQRKP